MTGSIIRHEAVVPLSAAGRRFDQALAEMFPDYSRSRLTTWIKAGAITLDGAPAVPRQLLKGGEKVRLEAELENEVSSEPEAIALDIVHEDGHLLVLNKPVGLVVHPGAGNPAGTLLNALLHHEPKLAELPRGGIVHRLDKDTSGLMVVAKTLAAHTALVDMLSRHDVDRQYEAVVLGALIAGGTIDAAVGRHHSDRLRERFRAHSLIQCNLETGRTHQIRVHMAHAGHPLVGDPLYGGSLKLPKRATPELVTALRGFRRQALHAERLAFEHPVTGEALSFDARRPDDMDALIVALRADLAVNGPNE